MADEGTQTGTLTLDEDFAAWMAAQPTWPPRQTRYAVEHVVNDRWELLEPDYAVRHDALVKMGEMIADGTATRGQIRVVDLWVTQP
jgi:hypothetical protein